MVSPTISKKKGARRLSLSSLGKEMTEPEVKRRMENHQKRTSAIISAVVASTMENPTRKLVTLLRVLFQESVVWKVCVICMI
ncbi:hypothetical protein C0J52_16479 [Blattella germanica]|nr:hypothetical protein C0J52_16479 [Blattella germanica]